MKVIGKKVSLIINKWKINIRNKENKIKITKKKKGRKK
jgi:hypothetical protein